MKKFDIKPVHDAQDKSFRFIANNWGPDFHINLKLIGKFKEMLLNDVAKDPKSGIRMDVLELAELEDGILILINIEHQSTKVTKIKIKVFDDYKNYSKCKYKYPLLTVIVSPYPKEEHVYEYHSTESDILKPIFITFDDAEIEKRLNTLRNNIDNKEIENHIVLDIAMISIFVLNNRYEVLHELCRIVQDAVGIKGRIKDDVVRVLSEMIKYKLKDNPEEVRELLEMLPEEIEIAKRGARIWFEEEFEQQALEHKNAMDEKDRHYAAVIADKDKAHADEILKKNQEIINLKTRLKLNGLL